MEQHNSRGYSRMMRVKITTVYESGRTPSNYARMQGRMQENTAPQLCANNTDILFRRYRSKIPRVSCRLKTTWAVKQVMCSSSLV